MARLPQPGGDNGSWGDILNDYLLQAHTNHGALKPGVVSYSTLDTDVQNRITGKADLATLSTVALSGNYTDLSNIPAAPTPSVLSVTVTTGAEARPTATTVLWVGGSTQPSHMTTGDLWFSTTPPLDTIVPSAPTGLSASSILSTSFTLSWNASTDNIGVTGYEVLLDGISHTIVAGTSTYISGRASATTYECTVRARDAAGNWSTLSTALSVTTDTSTTTQHTIFGSTPYPGLLKYDNGQPITVATAFYTAPSGTTGWKLTGARLFVPSGVTLPGSVDIVVAAPSGSVVPSLTAPTVSTTMTGITAGWNEVALASPLALTPDAPVWVGYRFADNSYLSTTSVGGTPVAALDGSGIFMAENELPDNRRRNYFYENTATTASHIGGQGYGIDIIVSEI